MEIAVPDYYVLILILTYGTAQLLLMAHFTLYRLLVSQLGTGRTYFVAPSSRNTINIVYIIMASNVNSENRRKRSIMLTGIHYTDRSMLITFLKK